jgi:hypothetical protein
MKRGNYRCRSRSRSVRDVSDGSGKAAIAWRPPLTSELFGARARADFWDILTQYPDALTLYTQLFPLATGGTLPLEQKLSEFATHSNVNIRRQFKQIPAYIADVLHRSSYEYRLDKGVYKRLVHALLGEGEHRVLFLLLNYDTLLEQALTEFDSRLSFKSLDDYVAHDRHALVYKLHGSVDWAVPISGADGRWVDRISKYPLEQLTANPVEILSDRSVFNGASNKSNFWYPMLTLPLANKSQDDFVCPQSHVLSLRTELESCKKFF